MTFSLPHVKKSRLVSVDTVSLSWFDVSEWRVLYVILTSFMLMVFILSVSWTFICCCRRWTRVSRRHFNTVMEPTVLLNINVNLLVWLCSGGDRRRWGRRPSTPSWTTWTSRSGWSSDPNSVSRFKSCPHVEVTTKICSERWQKIFVETVKKHFICKVHHEVKWWCFITNRITNQFWSKVFLFRTFLPGWI